jgi:hypothetical protein
VPAVKLSEHEAEVAVNRRLLGLFDEAALANANPDLPLHVHDWVSVSEGKVLMEADENVITATLRVEVWDRPLPLADNWPRTRTVPMVLMSGRLAVDEIEFGTRPLGFRLPTPGQWEVRLHWRTDNVEHASVLVQFWPPAAR